MNDNKAELFPYVDGTFRRSADGQWSVRYRSDSEKKWRPLPTDLVPAAIRALVTE